MTGTPAESIMGTVGTLSINLPSRKWDKAVTADPPPAWSGPPDDLPFGQLPSCSYHHDGGAAGSSAQQKLKEEPAPSARVPGVS
jgi:hypothetical protein